MIRYTQGNLLEAPTEALVNTVNEVGVMGKGIALMFREAFPANMAAYAAACKSGEVRVGRMFVTEEHDLFGHRVIVNFPTKKHWRHPSKLAWVQEGLEDLRRVIEERQIRSVAIPPLGCGNGRLSWDDVRECIEHKLGDLEGVEVLVFSPISEYQNMPKQAGVEELTPARACVAEMIRRYAVLGLECTNLEVQKLAWFLQRSILALGLANPLRLTFAANKYGPYSDGLRHLLDALDGSYLHCEKRLSDAGPFDLIWFSDDRRETVGDYLRGPEASEFAPALEKTAQIIDGFESPLGMELLATVDWLVAREHCPADVPSVRKSLAHWAGGHAAGERKLRLFDDRLLSLAVKRLGEVLPGE